MTHRMRHVFSPAEEKHISNFSSSTPKLHQQPWYFTHYNPSLEEYKTRTGYLLLAVYGAGFYHLHAGEKSLLSGSVTKNGGDETTFLHKECAISFPSDTTSCHFSHVHSTIISIQTANHQPCRQRVRSVWHSETTERLDTLCQNPNHQCPNAFQVQEFRYALYFSIVRILVTASSLKGHAGEKSNRPEQTRYALFYLSVA